MSDIDELQQEAERLRAEAERRWPGGWPQEWTDEDDDLYYSILLCGVRLEEEQEAIR